MKLIPVLVSPDSYFRVCFLCVLLCVNIYQSPFTSYVLVVWCVILNCSVFYATNHKLHCDALHAGTLHCGVLHATILNCVVLHATILHDCGVLHATILHSRLHYIYTVVLYCITLHPGVHTYVLCIAMLHDVLINSIGSICITCEYNLILIAW